MATDESTELFKDATEVSPLGTRVVGFARHAERDGLRVNKLFKKPPRKLASCQFKVEEGISPSTMAQLLQTPLSLNIMIFNGDGDAIQKNSTNT